MKPMRLLRVVALRCPLLTLLVVQCPITSAASDSVVSMTASADTFAFSPDRIIAHVGQQETVEIKSTQGVHGVASTELGIETTLIRPDHPITISFTPKSAGEYVVHCASVCGIGHKGMAFTVSVEP